MDQGLIPRRYAKALLLSAKDNALQGEVYKAMQALAAAFNAEPSMQKALANPAISPEAKLNLILAACGQMTPAVQASIEAFSKLLLQNRRIALTRDCAMAYISLYRSENKIYNVNISSASPLGTAEKGRLEQLVAARLPQGATAEFAYSTNPDLIGGFAINIDNQLLDASVAGQLKQLELKLLSH